MCYYYLLNHVFIVQTIQRFGPYTVPNVIADGKWYGIIFPANSTILYKVDINFSWLELEQTSGCVHKMVSFKRDMGAY